MNLVTLRETLRPMCENLWPRRNISESPVFVWQNVISSAESMIAFDRESVRYLIYTPAFREVLRSGNESGLPADRDVPLYRLPYPAFILYSPASDNGGANGRAVQTEVMVVVDNPNALGPDFLFIYPDSKECAAGLASLAHRTPGERLTAYTTRFFNVLDGTPLQGAYYQKCLSQTYSKFAAHMRTTNPDYPVASYESNEWFSQYRALMVQRVTPFLFEVFYPGNHMVSSRPARAGKSVEWVKSRTHFVMMDRRSMSHVTKSGSILTQSQQQEQVRRAAHSRRAHDRVLKSPRYGKNVGKRIQIAAQWVGPKEWQGTDGKIYVVADRKPGLAAA